MHNTTNLTTIDSSNLDTVSGGQQRGDQKVNTAQVVQDYAKTPAGQERDKLVQTGALDNDDFKFFALRWSQNKGTLTR